MTIKFAINGLGRIGRCIIRSLKSHNGFELVAVNSPSKIDDYVHLIKYDSVHGRYQGDIKLNNNLMNLDGKDILVFQSKEKLDWPNNIDIIFECSGKFRNKAECEAHLVHDKAKILVSAPCKDADATIILGVNDQNINKNGKIFSVGSCTTNCLAPVVKIINDHIGIVSGYVSTIHSYTNDQNLVDGSHKDLRRARAASMSMIPTSTGAAETIGEVIPELKGKIAGSAIRVPTANVSLIDFKFTTKNKTSKEALNEIFKKAANNDYKNIVAVSQEPLVSIDYNGTTASATIDLLETTVIDGSFCRILAWYDNEWAFAQRMFDVAKKILL